MALSLSPRALGRGIGSSARKIPGWTRTWHLA